MYKMYVLFAMLLTLAFILLLVTVYLTNRSNMKDPKAQLATNAFKSNDLLAYWSFDEGSGKVSEDKVSGIKDPIKYVFNEAKYKPSTDPLRKAGVKGGSFVFCQLEMHQNDKKNAAPKQSNFVNIRYEFLSYFHQGVL